MRVETFFAKFDPSVSWFDKLEPATDEDREFFPDVDAPTWRTVPLGIEKPALA